MDFAGCGGQDGGGGGGRSETAGAGQYGDPWKGLIGTGLHAIEKPAPISKVRKGIAPKLVRISA